MRPGNFDATSATAERRTLRPHWVALGGFALGLVAVAAAIVLAQRGLGPVAQPVIQPRCAYTATTTTCVPAGSSVDLQRVSKLATPYVELLQEFGLKPPSRFFLTGSSAAPATYVRLALPAEFDSPAAAVNRQLATTIAGPRPCASCAQLVRTSVAQARALLTWWLLRQVIGSVPARVTSAQSAWLVSDQANQWVLANYSAITNCDRVIRMPVPFATR